MTEDDVKRVANAIWGDIESERLSDEFGGVPFDEIWSRPRFLGIKNRLVKAARAAIAAMAGWRLIDKARYNIRGIMLAEQCRSHAKVIRAMQPDMLGLVSLKATGDLLDRIAAELAPKESEKAK